MTTIQIQCLCGDVKIELSGEPMVQCYCHCDYCQTAHGAAYVPVAVFPADAVKVVAGSPFTYMMQRTPRATCPRCGSRLYQEPTGHGIRGVNAKLLPEGSFKPQFHQQCQHAVLPIVDGLPHFKGYPAAMGGSDELVDW